MRHLLTASIVLGLGTALIGACGSSGGNADIPTSDDGGDEGTGPGLGPDGSLAGNDGPGGGGGGDGSGGGGGGGGCSPACTGGQICVKGTCECPTYQSFCNGACIPTSVDPKNCGKCGNVCTGATACSGGQCDTTCLPGLTLCANDHTCSDTQSDNDHCGNCTTKCPAGKGCSGGSCVNSVPLGPPPPQCVGGGPPQVNPPNQGGCLGGLAATTFRWTLCSCKDVAIQDVLLVDAYDSTKGPYKPGGMGGGVGADNAFQSGSSSSIWGDLWASSTGGISTDSSDVIKHEVRSGGRLSTNGSMTIGADAYANGSISGPTIGGKAYVPAGASVSPAPAGGIVHGPVSFPPPCDCAANQLIPITAMVQAHATKNDNAAIGLNPNVLASSGGPSRLDLPCGAYYLTSVTGPVTIWAHGQTALYIGGNVTSGSTLAFGVDPTGAFDVFIEGTLSESSGLTIGSPNYPALTRTYVGSTSGMSFSDAANIAGEIYAAYGPVDWSAGTDAYGSVFAGNFLGTSDVKIHYDLAVLQQGNSCPTGGGSGGGGGGSDGGGGGTGGGASCSSCRDCLNQACNAGKCGSCTTDADCCAPLICIAGSCEPALK